MAATDGESYQCPVSDCNRSFDSTMGRGVHIGHSHTEKEVRQLLLNDVRDLERAIGEFPTLDEFCEQTRWNTATIYNHFDDWGEVRECLGYESTAVNSSKAITLSDLIDELHRLHDDLGRVPRDDDMTKHGEYSTGTYHYRFDSWGHAVREAGYKPTQVFDGKCTESIYYGPNFADQRERALERDNYECQCCSISNEEHRAEYDHSLHAHHIRKARSFIPDEGDPDYDEMNALDNLIMLCSSCHKTFEGKWQDASPAEFARLAQLERNSQSNSTPFSVAAD